MYAHLSGLANKPVVLSCHSTVREFCDGVWRPYPLTSLHSSLYCTLGLFLIISISETVTAASLTAASDDQVIWRRGSALHLYSLQISARITDILTTVFIQFSSVPTGKFLGVPQLVPDLYLPKPIQILQSSSHMTPYWVKPRQLKPTITSEYQLVGCDAVQHDKTLPTFRDNILQPSLWFLAGGMFDLLFNPEDEGIIYIWNNRRTSIELHGVTWQITVLTVNTCSLANTLV